MEGCAMSNVPSNEDFERAARKMAERSRNLDKLREMFLQRFGSRYPLHEFCIMPQRDVDFRAYVFFDKNNDVETSKESGLNEEIIDFVYESLEFLGRGRRGEVTVVFEFDSNENVEENFEGDYYLRLL